jgi:hypothetical protein
MIVLEGEISREIIGLSRYLGAIHLSEDPLAWQRRVRGEWE